MSSFFSRKRFVYSVKVFPLNIKSIKPIQKYPHITESYACILKIFVLMLLFLEAEDKGWYEVEEFKEQQLKNALISFGICSTPKESKQVTLLLFTCKATQWIPKSECLSRVIIYAPSVILMKLRFRKLSRENTLLNLGSFS